MASADDYKTIELLRRMFDASGTGGYDEAGVVCPFCPRTHGDVSNVHLGVTHTFSGHDGYDAASAYGLNVRGDVVSQEFWAECGHSWVVAFGEHKDGLLVKIIEKPAEDEDSQS